MQQHSPTESLQQAVRQRPQTEDDGEQEAPTSTSQAEAGPSGLHTQTIQCHPQDVHKEEWDQEGAATILWKELNDQVSLILLQYKRAVDELYC